MDALHAQDPGYNALDVILSKHTHTHTYTEAGGKPHYLLGFSEVGKFFVAVISYQINVNKEQPTFTKHLLCVSGNGILRSQN